MKKKMLEERGSIAVYVSVVLLSFLIILTGIYVSSISVRKWQLKTVIGIKKSYEKDNEKVEEIYQKQLSKFIYEENFDKWNNYDVGGTTVISCNGILTLKSNSTDPMIHMNQVTSINPKEFRHMDIRYRTSSAAERMEFFMIENPTNQTYAINKSLICDGEWHILTIDFWENSNVKNREKITGWRWDWSRANNTTMEIDYIKIRK